MSNPIRANIKSPKAMTDYIDTILPEDTPAGQRSAVSRNDELITVEAGAGTGKTWTLSSRFTRLLLSSSALQPCLPQNILTLTYTEAASREMQERIRKKTIETINSINLINPAGNNARAIDTKSIKNGFDDAWISTIHSFSSRLIRESGLSLDIDPHASVLSSPQEDSFWDALSRALDMTLLSRFASPFSHDLRSAASELEKDEFVIAALEKWGTGRLCDLARDVAELNASLGRDADVLLKWSLQAESPSDPQSRAVGSKIASLLSVEWRETWEKWREIFQELENALRAERQKAKGSAGAVALASVMEKHYEKMSEESQTEGQIESQIESQIEDQMLFFLDICENLSGILPKIFKEKIEDALGGKITDWKADRKDILTSTLTSPLSPLSPTEQRLRAALLRFCAFAWRAWDETKRRRDLLSFNDLIRFAAISVSSDAKTKGFQHIMIDEFQDTDPLQDAMLAALRKKEGAKLFLVGDPKQAIYRFRHADLTLFADYVEKARQSGSEVRLDVSFRTRPSLLERTNSLFAHIWENGLGSDEKMKGLKFEPLTAPKRPTDSGGGLRDGASVEPFTLLLGASDELLSRKLARMLAAWSSEGRTVWDKKERLLRPVRWRDFAVLTPSRARYAQLEAAFAEEGIPVVLEKSRSYFARGEIADIVNTLKAAAFPNDESALAGWLSSPFSGASQKDIQACIELKKEVSDKNKRLLFTLLSERLPEAAERISALRRLGGLRGPSAVLSRLLEDRRWLSRYEASDRARVTANVVHAVSLARQYESGISPSLIGCADWLGAALSGGREMVEPEWMESGTDAVHVMTVHGSKGLEFPVVAVAGMDRRPGRGNAEQIAASKTMGVVVSAIPDMIGEGEAPPSSLKWERVLSERAEIEESQRLFYVAATRAQDSLILCGKINETKSGQTAAKNSWLSWTLKWLDESAEENVQIVYAPKDDSSEAEVKKISMPPIRTAVSKALSLPSSDADISLSSFSATSFALFEWCPFAWRRRYRQGVDLRWETPDELSDNDGRVGGSELGLLAHWILARWDMKEETLSKWTGENSRALSIMPTALRGAWRSAKNRKTLEEWLTSFATSSEGRAVSAALERGELLRENAFSLAIEQPASQGEAPAANNGKPPPMLKLVGATDAIWMENGRWHVRDYKISTQNHAPAELYRSQLAFYALATTLMCPDDPCGVDVGLVFLRAGGELRERKTFGPGRAEFDALRGQIAEAAHVAARGPWIAMREHCRSCPWRRKCPKR
ncbi:exodeoxyribonuclease V [Synergistales bacterium]|nr:exodeoxyribonuclease V [Synergistales bacterium]